MVWVVKRRPRMPGLSKRTLRRSATSRFTRAPAPWTASQPPAQRQTCGCTVVSGVDPYITAGSTCQWPPRSCAAIQASSCSSVACSNTVAPPRPGASAHPRAATRRSARPPAASRRAATLSPGTSPARRALPPEAPSTYHALPPGAPPARRGLSPGVLLAVMVQRGAQHLRVQVHRRHRAVVDTVAGALLGGAVLEQPLEHGPVEGTVPHRAVVLFEVGLDVGLEVHQCV